MDITIGRVVNFHGIRGEVKVSSHSDFTKERFAPGNVVKIGDENFEIENYRLHKNFHMLKFVNVNHIDEVEHLKGKDVTQNNAAINLFFEEDEFHFYDIIGLKVYTDAHEYIGEVTSIFQTGANDVWVVNGKKEYMIPYIEDVVSVVDLEKGIIIVTPMEGLLE